MEKLEITGEEADATLVSLLNMSTNPDLSKFYEMNQALSTI